MNIQNVPVQASNVDNNKQMLTEQQIKQPATQVPQDNTLITKPSELSLGDQNNINELLKQLTDKISLSQKVIDNLPEALKEQIRSMLTQNATLVNLTNGLSNLLQGQKEIFKDLSNLSEVLDSLAKLLAQAEQGEEQLLLPKFSEATTKEKELFLQKQNLELLKQLLDNLGNLDDPKTKELLKKLVDNDAKLQQNKPSEQLPETNKPQVPTNNANTKPQEQQLKELIKTLVEQQSDLSKTLDKSQTQPLKEQITKSYTQTEKQPAEQKTTQPLPNAKQEQGLDKNNQVAKELESILNKDLLKEVITKLQTVSQTMEKALKQQSQDLVKQEVLNDTTKQVPVDNKTQARENSLLEEAKNALPNNKLPLQEVLKPQDILKLVKNLQTLSSTLEQLATKDENLLKAMQTLTKNPELLTSEQKELLKDAVSQTLKQTFKEGAELSTLQKALQSTTTKETAFLDKQLADLKNFDKLLKNYESLQFSSKQVQQWSSALRDLASDMLKTANLPAERSAQHMQTSFVFNLATDGQEKPRPVYINIYHEKGSQSEDYTKLPETWLKINVNPEYVGEVTAIFHLYQENLLDVKVIFKNPEGMDEFSRFIPDIQSSLTDSNMQLNSILVI